MNRRGEDRPLFGRQSKVMTVEEVSEYLHVHPSTIYRLIKRRKIPAFRIGSDWRFNIETIDKWRAEMEVARHSPQGTSQSRRTRRGPDLDGEIGQAHSLQSRAPHA